MTALTTSTADLKLNYSINPTNGQLIVDLVLTPGNDVQLVAGIQRLAQDILRYLATPRGSNPFDPTYGNPLFQFLGRPSEPDPSIFLAMVQQAEQDFVQRQQLAASQGFLSLDEQVDHFVDTQVYLSGSLYSADNKIVPTGAVYVTFTVVSQAGTTQQVVAPFSLVITI